MGIYIFYLIFFVIALLASTELVRHSKKKRGKLLDTTNRAMHSDGTRTDLTSTNRMRVKQIVSQVGHKRAENDEVTDQEETQTQASGISLDNGEDDLPDPFVSSAKLPKGTR